MSRVVCALGILLMSGVGSVSGQKAEKPPPPFIAELLKLTPEEFIKRFDKNGDGGLSKNELPPFLARNFERTDRDSNGKLDRDEAAAVQSNMRAFFGQKTSAEPLLDRIVDNILARQDANKDGKITRAEAKARLADVFDKVDANGDGVLDRAELRVLARRIQANGGGAGLGGPAAAKPAGPDFDALDKNADGRLTAEELRGTPYFARFSEIDTDRSGRVDRREFENYLKRETKK
jgi:Ca2+-binding EF-hand superfamily protein